MIPVIQVMAHLNQFLRWRHIEDQYGDIGDTLNVGRKETLQLVERMLESLRQSFSSPKVHLGMDEAFFLGRGSYFDEFGPKSKAEIMSQYLDDLLAICSKHEVEPIIWDDMFFSEEADQTQYERLHEKINLMYWDYYSEDPSHYEEKMTQRKLLTNNLSFAGAAWKWLGYAPHHKKTLHSSIAALSACKKHQIRDVIVTTWGDDGSEAPLYVSLFGVVLYAYLDKAERYSEEAFNEWLLYYTAESLEDWLKQGQFDLPEEFDEMRSLMVNPSKYFLYQDLLNPVFKVYIEAIDMDYGRLMRELQAHFAHKQTGNRSVNQFYAALAECLENKWNLPLDIAKAYEANDKEALQQLVDERLNPLAEQLMEVLKARRTVWLEEAKPLGLEILEFRFGAMHARVLATISRLEDFIAGNTDRLAELEETFIDPTPGNEHATERASHYTTALGIMSRNKHV